MITQQYTVKQKEFKTHRTGFR